MRWRAREGSRPELIEEDARRDGYVERFDGGADRERHAMLDARKAFRGQASTLVADKDSEPRGRCHLVEWSASGVGAPEGNGPGPEERIELGPGTHESRPMEERAHRTS